MGNPIDAPDQQGTPKHLFAHALAAPRRAIASALDPSSRTMQAIRLVAVLAGLMLWAYTSSLAAGVLAALALAGPLSLARRWRVKRMATDLHRRLRELIRSEEEAADRAQDRRVWRRVLRGQWQALLFSSHREEERATVRASRYVHLSTLGGGVLPTREHITDVTVRWAPLVEINRGDIRERIQSQVAAWWGLAPDEVEVAGGWDTVRCRVTFVRKAGSDLPTSVPYPGPLTGEDTREDRGDRETRGGRERETGRSGGVYDPGKPRWSNWPYGERSQ